MVKKVTKNSNNKVILFSALAIIVVLSGCGNSTTTKQTISQETVNKKVDTIKQSTTDTDGDTIPDNAEVVLGTDPQNPDTDGDGIDDKNDQNPTLVDKMFEKSTGPNDFLISKVLVENNVDEITGKGVVDHLEIFLKNDSQKSIKDFSVYYEYNDLVNNSKQSYQLPLREFVLNPGESKSVHIDTGEKAGHFRANPNSSYYQTINPKEVKVVVISPNHQSQEASVKKDKGGAETAD